MKDEIVDINQFPYHMQGDYRIRNENIRAGRELCKHCNSTGNELYSMYRKCPECDGKGYK